MKTPIVKVTGLETWFGDQLILNGLDFEIYAGEVVALLGGNGSGKTTLLRSLLGLVPHQEGTIEIFGTPLGSFKAWGRIGYVPQRGRIQVPNATVTEVVKLGRLANRKLFFPASAADRKAVAEALERVQLTKFAKTPMSQLSGGQQQRALIARALASQAEFLILDEPLAALDLRTQTSLARLLGDLQAEGLTILVVLHELGAMEGLLNRSIVLQDGRIVHDGPLSAGPGIEPPIHLPHIPNRIMQHLLTDKPAAQED